MNRAGDGSILAVDIGNSNIKFGVHRNGAWERRYRISTVRTKTPDEYGLSLRSLLAESGVAFADIETAVVSSVVPPLTSVFNEMLEQQMERPPLVVGPGVRTGIRIRTDNPVEVGSDIVANAVAAHAHCRERCIVIAFGTAITLTAISADGDLLGAAPLVVAECGSSVGKTTARRQVPGHRRRVSRPLRGHIRILCECEPFIHWLA